MHVAGIIYEYTCNWVILTFNQNWVQDKNHITLTQHFAWLEMQSSLLKNNK